MRDGCTVAKTDRRLAFTARLREWVDSRRADGATFASIADGVGVSANTVERWYHGRGQRDLHETSAERLCAAMGLVDEDGRADTEALYAPLD